MSERKTVKTWEKTRVQFLYRHKSGSYYARCFAGGKEHWQPLDTSHFQVAQARLPKELKKIRAAFRSGAARDRKPMVWKDVAKVFRASPSREADPKPSTIDYWGTIVDAIEASWPGLADLDIRKITPKQCRQWAECFAEEYSAGRYNSALSAMRNIFKIAIREGARFDNPMDDETIKRRRVRASIPELPSTENFTDFVNEIRAAGGRFSADCADFVQGLAFTGLRQGEAKWMRRRHLDFERNRIRVVGHPEDGTKGGEERAIPMIPEARTLFSRMLAERPDEVPEMPVFRVNEAQKAMDRAAKVVGMERITHHDLRHLFATTCIESGVDIPTISRWLGHKDGGALAMRTYGHLRDEHSSRQAARVTFQPANESKVIPMEGAA